MKQLIITALIFLSFQSKGQEFTQTISEPVCDTFKLLTIKVLSSTAPQDGNLDSLNVYYRKETANGVWVEGNIKIPNDTGLINPVKRGILLKANKPN